MTRRRAFASLGPLTLGAGILVVAVLCSGPTVRAWRDSETCLHNLQRLAVEFPFERPARLVAPHLSCPATGAHYRIASDALVTYHGRGVRWRDVARCPNPHIHVPCLNGTKGYRRSWEPLGCVQ